VYRDRRPHRRWSCAVDGGLTTGRHTVSATVTDPTGLTRSRLGRGQLHRQRSPARHGRVGTVVGPTNHSYGMDQGRGTLARVRRSHHRVGRAGLTARTSANGNIYFDIADPVAHAGFYQATFTISYYDAGTGSFACSTTTAPPTRTGPPAASR